MNNQPPSKGLSLADFNRARYLMGKLKKAPSPSAAQHAIEIIGAEKFSEVCQDLSAFHNEPVEEVIELLVSALEKEMETFNIDFVWGLGGDSTEGGE